MSPFDGAAGFETRRTAEAAAVVDRVPRSGGGVPLDRGLAGRFLLLAGPAVLASTAYMDPGNFAVNVQAGSRYGYTLLWVVLLANLVAMLFQALSAKLGLATGRNLAELCRDHFPRPIVWGMWAISELAAIATDLAELLGGAIGLNLLLGLPILRGMAVTAAASCAILVLDRINFRFLEAVVAGFVLLIAAGCVVLVGMAPTEWGAAATGLAVPSLADTGAVEIAVGIVGATVMPHALFLHSGLTQPRAMRPSATDRGPRTRRLIRASHAAVATALGIAGLVNLSIVLLAAAALPGLDPQAAALSDAYRLLGGGAALLFVLVLLASGISSTLTGTLAGQIVVQGFTGIRIPIWVRRLLTLVPAFVLVASGLDPTQALVWSQIALSLALPAPMLALLVFTQQRRVMGEFANGRATGLVAVAGTALVLMLNLVLLAEFLA